MRQEIEVNMQDSSKIVWWSGRMTLELEALVLGSKSYVFGLEPTKLLNRTVKKGTSK